MSRSVSSGGAERLDRASHVPEELPGSYRGILGCLAFIAFGIALGQSMIVPALSTLQRSTDATAGGIAWVITSYLLVSAVTMPVAAKLGALFGNRRVLVILMVIYTLGSMCAVWGVATHSLPLVVAGRCLQGCAAGEIPLAFAVIRDEAPAHRVASGIVLISAMLALGGAISLPLGGLIIDYADVVWIFIVGAVSAAISAIYVRFALPRSRNLKTGRIDVVGAILLSLGLAAVLLALSNATIWGWTSPRVWGLTGVGIFVLATWVRYERGHSDPLVNVRILVGPAVLRTNLATFFLGYGVFGSFFLLPLLLQLPSDSGGLQLSATQAGFMTMPVALVNLAFSPVVATTDRLFGPKPAVVFGCAMAVITMAIVALLPASIPGILVASVVWGIAFSTAMAAVSNLIVHVVDKESTGEAVAVNMIIRNIGSAAGAQVGATLITVFAMGTFPVVGYSVAFGGAALACLLAGLLIVLVPVSRSAIATGAQRAA